MLSRGQLNLIRSLDRKRTRDEEGSFVVEGDKMVRELLFLPPETGFRIKMLCAVPKWLAGNLTNPTNKPAEAFEISESELERISHLKTPNQVLAVVEQPAAKEISIDFETDLALGLDRVQDPGNAGTIIRIAEWFGIRQVFFSTDSADFFSPKAVQASMGSIFRVRAARVDLPGLVEQVSGRIPVYGTSLQGMDIFSAELTSNGIILLGNESTGLDPVFSPHIRTYLKIPSYSGNSVSSDSLNVAIAAAIISGEFRRRYSC